MAYADTLHRVTIETALGAVDCVAASYGGIPFFVEEATGVGGRNVVTSPLPFTSLHVNEDIGAKVREYSLKFYILGEDAEKKRESLEEAFNTAGAKELVHPHYGNFYARCTGYSVSFSRLEAEYISGEASFVPECDPKKAGTSSVDLHGLAVSKADDTIEKAIADFVSGFSILSKAKTVVDACADVTTQILDDIEIARESIRSVSKFVSKVSQFRGNVELILRTPADFAARLSNLLTMTRETLDDDGGSLGYANESLTLMDSVEVASGDLAADSLSAKIQTLTLMLAASMVVKFAVEAEFSDSADVRELQERISESFGAARGKVSSVSDYSTLADLEAVAEKHLSDAVSNLSVIVEYPLSKTRDALSVCFDIYGSLDRLDDILERNAVTDPLFIMRKSLKVLSK